MPDADFINGLLIGVVGSVLVGFVARQILLGMHAVRGFFRAPVVAQNVPRTPAQAAVGCVQGLITVMFWVALVVGLAALWLSGRVRIEVL